MINLTEDRLMLYFLMISICTTLLILSIITCLISNSWIGFGLYLVWLIFVCLTFFTLFDELDDVKEFTYMKCPNCEKGAKFKTEEVLKFMEKKDD